MTLRDCIRDIREGLAILQLPATTEFKRQRKQGAQMMLKGAIQKAIQETQHSPEQEIAKRLQTAKVEEMPSLLDMLAQSIASKPQETSSFNLQSIPSEIRDELSADLGEADACLRNGCYRSAIILCGRVLETALHRKYFDATGQDLLEKAPGTGLGNLIAKLSEKGVGLDPGLANQIHLINQVRVFSVHKKIEPFAPSKMQAQAIMLYTRDVLEKVFR